MSVALALIAAVPGAAVAENYGQISKSGEMSKGWLSKKLQGAAHHPIIAKFILSDVLPALNASFGKSGDCWPNRRLALAAIIDGILVGNRPDGKTEVGIGQIKPLLDAFKTMAPGKAAHAAAIKLAETLQKDKGLSAFFVQVLEVVAKRLGGDCNLWVKKGTAGPASAANAPKADPAVIAKMEADKKAAEAKAAKEKADAEAKIAAAKKAQEDAAKKAAADKVALEAKAKQAAAELEAKLAAQKKAQEDAAKAKAAAEAERKKYEDAAREKAAKEAFEKALKLAAEKAAAEKAALEAKIKADKAKAEEAAAKKAAELAKQKAEAEKAQKAAEMVAKMAKDTQISAEDAKAAECDGIKAQLTALESKLAGMAKEHAKGCTGEDQKKAQAEIQKLNTEFNLAMANVNKAMAEVQDKIKASSGKDPCNENMTLEECVVAVDKAGAAEKQLAEAADRLKKEASALSASQAKRGAEMAKAHNEQVLKCQQLELAKKKQKKENAAFVAQYQARLSTCMSEFGAACMAGLAAHAEKKKTIEEIASLNAQAQSTTARCVSLKKSLRGLEADYRATRDAVKKLGCLTDRQFAELTNGQAKAIVKMPKGSEEGRKKFMAAAVDFKKTLEVRKADQAKCTGDLAKRLTALQGLEKFVHERNSELNACNVQIKVQRAKIAAVEAKLAK
jgi:hypothetical protein